MSQEEAMKVSSAEGGAGTKGWSSRTPAQPPQGERGGALLSSRLWDGCTLPRYSRLPGDAVFDCNDGFSPLHPIKIDALEHLLSTLSHFFITSRPMGSS